jgi:hypothetical protein
VGELREHLAGLSDNDPIPRGISAMLSPPVRKAVSRKAWTPKPGAPGTNLTYMRNGVRVTAQVWSSGPRTGTVWAVPMAPIGDEYAVLLRVSAKGDSATYDRSLSR